MFIRNTRRQRAANSCAAAMREAIEARVNRTFHRADLGQAMSAQFELGEHCSQALDLVGSVEDLVLG